MHHALALIGEPAYGPGFTHFDWVNPDAPKGGRVRLMAFGTFDSLNPYAVKGNAPRSLPIIYDRLMLTSPDEPSTSYGLVAEWVAYRHLLYLGCTKAAQHMLTSSHPYRPLLERVIEIERRAGPSGVVAHILAAGRGATPKV